MHGQSVQIVTTTPEEFRAIVAEELKIHAANLLGTLLPREGVVKRFITNEEAMRYLGVSRTTLARYRKNGTLPYAKLEGGAAPVYYRLADIEALLESRVVGR